LSGLVNLSQLSLDSNQIINISALSGLTGLYHLDLDNNEIIDILPLVNNSGLASGDYVHLEYNPLNAASVNTYIPALQGRGVTVYYTPPEDVNYDGVVNVLDMIRIGQHWGQTGSGGWILEDVNSDGVISVLDMIIIGQHWTS